MMHRNNLPQSLEPDMISFSLGHPDRSALPVADLKTATMAAFKSHALSMLEYGPLRGEDGLITCISNKLNRDENLNIEDENLMIISGSTHGIDMICRLFVGAGGGILLEAPTYKDAIHIFRDHKSELHPLPMDENGVIIEAMKEIVERLHNEGNPAKLFYTIPNFQNPTGRTTTEERRKAVLDLARKYDFKILEDDVYRDIQFEGNPPLSYFALADGREVLRIGSFSKNLAPGLRLGWLIGKSEVLEICMNYGTTQMGGGANPFVSHIVAQYVSSGKWESHVSKLRGIYRDRRDIALSALERFMPAGVQWTVPSGGIFLWITLPPNVTVSALEAASLQKKVVFSAGSDFFVSPEDGKHNFRLAYSFAEPDELEEGIRILAETVEELAHSMV
jgi:DNA-binding transcriptional MocR family regulator